MHSQRGLGGGETERRENEKGGTVTFASMISGRIGVCGWLTRLGVCLVLEVWISSPHQMGVQRFSNSFSRSTVKDNKIKMCGLKNCSVIRTYVYDIVITGPELQKKISIN